MATHDSALQQRIQQVIADDPNNEIAKKVQTVLAEFSANQAQLAKIPSINEFSNLLYEVTTDLQYESQFFNQNDMLLLNISDKLTIYFGRDDDNKTTEYPKLAILSDSNEVDQATNTLSMTKYDIFNCLLIGCRKVFDGISNEMIKNEMTTNDEKKHEVVEREATEGVLDAVFVRISQYLNNSYDQARNIDLKEDILGIWSLLKSFMSFNSILDKQCWIYRLAMILMILNDDDDDSNESECPRLKQLSFVEEKSDELNVLFLSQNRQSLSLLKEKLVQIGGFSQVYDLIVDKSTTNAQILTTFVAYHCYFEKLSQIGSAEDNHDDTYDTNKGEESKAPKEEFLLSMQEPSKNMTLIGAARERGDVNLEQSLTKYIVKNEMINKKLNKYGDYIGEMIKVLHKEFPAVE